MQTLVVLLATIGIVAAGGGATALDGGATPVVDDSSLDCEVESDGHCYWTYVQRRNGVNYQRAVEICREHDSVPAVIPNQDAYRNLLRRVRAKIPRSRTWTTVWTGMKFNPKTRQETPGNAYWRWFFIPAHDQRYRIPWAGDYYAYPYTNVYVEVKKLARSRFQGMINREPESSKRGVICQKLD